ncbi:MAG: HIT family protein [Pseudomonadota bacterium]
MTAYDNDNVFAKIMRGEIPSQTVYEDDRTFVIMDIMPRAEGHCLVIPKAPSRNLYDIDPADLAAVATTVQTMVKAVTSAFDAEGVTIQQFNEAAAGQEVFHTHVHILPRHAGVKLNPPGNMGDMDVIAANAEKIRAAL